MRKLKLEELKRLSVEDFRTSEKLPVCIVLDNIRSLHNVGSVFRTADAFRAEKIFLTGITGTPPHREIHKTALGATESVSWHYEERPETAVATLKQAGYTVVVAEQTDCSVSLHQFAPAPAQKIALVLGNEIHGVSEAVISLADVAVEIPQLGTKHSLNVSVCAGIILWELVRKLKFAGPV
ncbi:MAG: tRNA/rRNA methyltransferase [Cyclobacteriaceae bacterium]|nr:MAG: tRNA/rRNA methyltransferase [Cyclobacteriaceae bacterium]